MKKYRFSRRKLNNMLRKRHLISTKNDQKMAHFWQFLKWPFKRAFLKSQEKSWSLIRKKQNFSNFLIKINGNFWFFCHFYNFDFFHRKLQKSHFFEFFLKKFQKCDMRRRICRFLDRRRRGAIFRHPYLVFRK